MTFVDESVIMDVLRTRIMELEAEEVFNNV